MRVKVKTLYGYRGPHSRISVGVRTPSPMVSTPLVFYIVQL